MRILIVILMSVIVLGCSSGSEESPFAKIEVAPQTDESLEVGSEQEAEYGSRAVIEKYEVNVSEDSYLDAIKKVMEKENKK